MKNSSNLSRFRGGFMKYAIPGLTVLGLTMVGAHAAATDVTSAISTVAADAGTGVTAGVGIGAVVFGGKVVWNAIKSMAS